MKPLAAFPNHEVAELQMHNNIGLVQLPVGLGQEAEFSGALLRKRLGGSSRVRCPYPRPCQLLHLDMGGWQISRNGKNPPKSHLWKAAGSSRYLQKQDNALFSQSAPFLQLPSSSSSSKATQTRTKDPPSAPFLLSAQVLQLSSSSSHLSIKSFLPFPLPINLFPPLEPELPPFLLQTHAQIQEISCQPFPWSKPCQGAANLEGFCLIFKLKYALNSKTLQAVSCGTAKASPQSSSQLIFPRFKA